MIGKNIAHYQITAKLGKGGMGEVYRATDVKLDRDVAIKLLPSNFAADKERLARFEREAKTLASLNHPNIAGIYGLEQTADSKALILEIVEGEDLSERLKRGPMAVDEVMEIGMQIADALKAAHAKSIIHRDLKPGNIKLSQDGNVKVLDFGLAKALSDEADSTDLSCPEDSPTITDAFTQPGTILGTAAYMSPEQARGKRVDHRSDIWAFGCILYECLTGKKVFEGGDITEILASIIKSEPEWTSLPANTPTNLTLLIRKCLAKDCRKRLQHIDDACIDLEQYVFEHSLQVTQRSQSTSHSLDRKKPLTPTLAIIGSLLLFLAGYSLSWVQQKGNIQTEERQTTRRFNISSGANVEILRQAGTSIQFSPDGKIIGFISSPPQTGGTSLIYLRRLDQLAANPIPGTEGADQFCFSPDGTHIAFRNQIVNEIQVIPIIGGATQKVCISNYPGGMDWGNDGRIYFAEEFGPIYQVAATGGSPAAITQLTNAEKSHRWPSSVGQGKGVLFSASVARGAWGNASIVLKRLSDGNRSVCPKQGTHARLLADGHLVYVTDDQLFGCSILMESLEFPSEVVVEPLVQNVSKVFGGVAHFDVSSDGLLAYLDNTKEEPAFTMDWIHRDGTIENLLPADTYGQFRLSPDGNAITYAMRGDIWVYDIVRRISTNISYAKEQIDIFPMWTPSGKSVFFTRFHRDGMSICWRRIDQSNEVQNLRTGGVVWFPWTFHPSGDHLICYIESAEGLADQRLLNLEGDDTLGWIAKESVDLIASTANEADCYYSDDGSWLAFSSNESGTHQIYVVNASATGARLPVSEGQLDSRHPTWSKIKSELLFGTRTDSFRLPFSVNPELAHQVNVAPFSETDGIPTVGSPTPWPNAICYGRFDIHPDGEKILVRRKIKDSKNNIDQINLFEGFTNYIKEQFSDASNVSNSH